MRRFLTSLALICVAVGVAAGSSKIDRLKARGEDPERFLRKSSVLNSPVVLNSGWLSVDALQPSVYDYFYVEMREGGVIWLYGWDASDNDIAQLSTDGGSSWKKIALGTTSGGAFSGWDANLALYATWDGVIKQTTDGGDTWTDVYSYPGGPLGAFFDDVAFLNADTAFAYGDGVNSSMTPVGIPAASTPPTMRT